MVTSDEPGLYLTGKYGIRHESLTLCTLYKKTEFGDFLQLEPITLVPFDLDGINKDDLTSEEKTKLNNYHKLVFDTISKYLNKEEASFLKKYTKENPYLVGFILCVVPFVGFGVPLQRGKKSDEILHLLLN